MPLPHYSSTVWNQNHNTGDTGPCHPLSMVNDEGTKWFHSAEPELQHRGCLALSTLCMVNDEEKSGSTVRNKNQNTGDARSCQSCAWVMTGEQSGSTVLTGDQSGSTVRNRNHNTGDAGSCQLHAWVMTGDQSGSTAQNQNHHTQTLGLFNPLHG